MENKNKSQTNNKTCLATLASVLLTCACSSTQDTINIQTIGPQIGYSATFPGPTKSSHNGLRVGMYGNNQPHIKEFFDPTLFHRYFEHTYFSQDIFYDLRWTNESSNGQDLSENRFGTSTVIGPFALELLTGTFTNTGTFVYQPAFGAELGHSLPIRLMVEPSFPTAASKQAGYHPTANFGLRVIGNF